MTPEQQREWYMRRQGIVRGPFSARDVTRYILLGRIRMLDELSSDRITWRCVNSYTEMLPPVIAANKGKWDYHEILAPGILLHVGLSGDECYTVRVGSPRLVSIEYVRELCDIADKHCEGYLRFTTRNNVEFMTDSKEKCDALVEDLKRS